MDNKLIILIIVAIAIIVIVGIFASNLFWKEKPPVIEGPSEIVPPAATGNVDDLVDALLKEIADIEPLLTQEDGDAVLINNGSQEIGDFGQSVNEDEI